MGGFNVVVGTTVDTRDIKKVESTFGQMIKRIDTMVKTASGEKLTRTVQTFTREVKNSDGTVTKYVQTVKGLKNAQDQWVDSTGKVLKNQGGLVTKQEQTTKAVKTSTDAINQNSQALKNQGQAASDTTSVFDNFVTSVTKLAYLKVANSALQLFSEACSEAKEAILDLDNAIVEFNKVSDLADTGDLQQYIEDLGELGKTVARTQSEMLEGATQFVKSGYTEEDAKTLSQVNSLLQNVADSELSAGDAANVLISTMKGFNIAAEDAEHVVDAINNVSNAYAVSSTDISDGLANVASTADAAGNTMEETIGMLTGMVEITQNASKSSRGLRQIIARLTQTLDENSGTGQKLTKIYADLGISLKDDEGQLRSTYDILGDLAEQWDKLDSNTQQYIALTSAGSNQVNNFLALMKNFNTTVKATATAYDSAGSAMKENEAYMDSIGAKLKLIQANFQQLVNGDGGLNKLIKLVLDAANAFLTFANSGAGKVTLVMTALGLSISAISKNLDLIKNGFITVFGKVIPQNVLLAIASEQGFNGVLKATIANISALSAAEKTSLILFAASAVVAGIYAISKAFGKLGDEVKSVSDEIEDASNFEAQSKEAQSSIKELRKELKDVQNQIKEVNDLTLKVTNADDYTRLQAQSNELKNQEQTLKNQLAIQLAKEESAQREYDLTIKTLKDSQGYASFSSYHDEDTTAINLDGKHATLEQSFTEGMTAAVLLNRAIADLQDQIDDLDKSSETYEEDLKDLQDKQDAYKDTLGEVKDQMVDTVDAAGKIIEANQDTDGTIQGLLDRWNMLTGTTDQVNAALEALGDDEEEFNENTQETVDLIESLTDSLSEVASAYDALQAAQTEYNQYGTLSLNTLNNLLEKYPQYIQYLYDENGNINLNTDALLTLAEARKADALQQVAQAEAADLQAYSEGNLNDVSETGKAILEAYGNKVKYVGEEADKAADKVVEYAYAVAAANVASGAPVEGATLDGLNALKEGWDDIRKAIADTDVAVTTHNEHTKKGAKDTAKANEKAAEDSEKAWKEAFEKEKAVLEHMHEMGEISDEEFYRRLLELNEQYFGEASGHHEKYLKEYLKNEEEVYKGLANAYKKKVEKQKKEALKAIDAEINAVKKAKDAALKAIDEKIKALKKQKEAAIKAVEAEIKALEKAKEAQHKYLQEKIDALQRAHDLQEKINKLEEYENQLAQAKQQRVWVMKDGQFQLGENEEAINSAEQQLSDYKDDLDYERQIQELQDLQEYWDEYYDNLIEKKEKYKEYLEEYYDAQIEAMEEYRDRVEEEYDAQIEALEEYRDQVEEMYDEMLENYQEHVKEMLEKFDEFNKGNEEKYGVAIEALRAFVSEWNSLIESMESIDGTMGAVTGFASGMVSLKGHSAGAAEIGAYASGNNSSVKDNEIALVGESPNTEMLIGSKLNTGVVARLHKGSGVVNAESTKTLAGILNGLGKNSYIGNGTSGVTQQFSFGSISLPNVTDANSFVETLKNTFSSYSIKYASVRT